MPVFISPMVRAATVRHVSRHATLLVRALLLAPLIFFDDLFAHPRADPRVLLVVRLVASTRLHVLLVVRWLRQPAFTFFSWSAGCVTSLHSFSHRALRVESLLSSEPWLCDVAIEALCCCLHGTPCVTYHGTPWFVGTVLLRRRGLPRHCSRSRRHHALIRSR